jgi:hypothetical protein
MNIYNSRALLQDAKSLNNRIGHAVCLPRDVEILKGALSLSTPQLADWNINCPESIKLYSKLHLWIKYLILQIVSLGRAKDITIQKLMIA